MLEGESGQEGDGGGEVKTEYELQKIVETTFGWVTFAAIIIVIGYGPFMRKVSPEYRRKESFNEIERYSRMNEYRLSRYHLWTNLHKTTINYPDWVDAERRGMLPK